MNDERRDQPEKEPDSDEPNEPEDAAEDDPSSDEPPKEFEPGAKDHRDQERAQHAGGEDEDASDGSGGDAPPDDSVAGTDAQKPSDETAAGGEAEETLFWRLAPYLIAAAFIFELLLFGSRGDLTVCVAKKGAHDFDLVGQEKTDKNRWRFPYCESALNIGFVSRYDEQVAEARNSACRRATMLQYKQERSDCAAGRQHWEMRVDAKQVAPWERRFYRRLIGLE